MPSISCSIYYAIYVVYGCKEALMVYEGLWFMKKKGFMVYVVYACKEALSSPP